jgi:hypothetical protein
MQVEQDKEIGQTGQVVVEESNRRIKKKNGERLMSTQVNDDKLTAEDLQYLRVAIIFVRNFIYPILLTILISLIPIANVNAY